MLKWKRDGRGWTGSLDGEDVFYIFQQSLPPHDFKVTQNLDLRFDTFLDAQAWCEKNRCPKGFRFLEEDEEIKEGDFNVYGDKFEDMALCISSVGMKARDASKEWTLLRWLRKIEDSPVPAGNGPKEYDEMVPMAAPDSPEVHTHHLFIHEGAFDGIAKTIADRVVDLIDGWGHEECESSFDTFKRDLAEDEGWAWAWHCNLAVMMQHEGVSHKNSNLRAAQFMKTAFGIDVTKFDVWQLCMREFICK